MPQTISRNQKWNPPPLDKRPIFLRSELDDYGLNVYEFRVLAHIARREGKKGCYSKQKTIAEFCGMSSRKAQDVLRVLCGAGLITRQERDGNSNIYRIAASSEWKHPNELDKIRKTWKFTEDSTKPLKEEELDELEESDELEDLLTDRKDT